MDQDDGKGGQPLDQGDRLHFPDRDDGDAEKALRNTLRAAAADQPVQGNAGRRAAPLLHDDVAPPLLHVAAPVQVRALLREGPAAFALAAAYRDVAGDGDLGLAAWARHGVIYPALLLPRAAAVRSAFLLAGAHRLVARAAASAHHPARACLLALLREAPAAFAVAAAYGYRNVADDGDLGLAAWARLGCLYPCTLLVLAGAHRLVARAAASAHLPARACLREAPAAFAVAAAYGYRNVAADGDIGSVGLDALRFGLLLPPRRPHVGRPSRQRPRRPPPRRRARPPTQPRRPRHPGRDPRDGSGARRHLLPLRSVGTMHASG